MARVLIIDDEAGTVDLVTGLLSSWGHEAASAADAAAGLEACRSFRPDLILLDYHLPGDTGAHLFENIRRNGSTARIPILFMSAMAAPEKIYGEIAESSLTRFIAKPFRIAELKSAVEELLRPPPNRGDVGPSRP